MNDLSESLEAKTILIIGGTTEGKTSATVCDEATKPYFYSTKYTLTGIDAVYAESVSGGLDSREMISFCKEQNVGLIIDAAHPYAIGVHGTVSKVKERLRLPVIRFAREDIILKADNVKYFDSFEQVEQYLLDKQISPLLALTGVNTLSKLQEYYKQYPCYLRIMRREESLNLLGKSNFPSENILFYEDTVDDVGELRKLEPAAILTKDSGKVGGMEDKIALSNQLKIPLLVISKPSLPYKPDKQVFGPYGLRRAIEDLLPDFFPLKTGYTTGTCATAATVAALIALFSKKLSQEVTIQLPSSELISLTVDKVEILSEDSARAVVIKFSGDDPDVTNGLPISVVVNKLDSCKNSLKIIGGEGVGRVTLPGLGIPLGEYAINKTPKRMIENEVDRLRKEFSFSNDLTVEISVIGGFEIAKKTFNPKLGIVDGISIIGTSGIIRPFSKDAFLDSIRREVEVAKAIGIRQLVINSGAKSEKFIKALFPNLPDQAFIHYGNFIGDTIKIASEVGFNSLTLGLMIGKAVKLAEGHLDTHSKVSSMNKEFLAQIAIDLNFSKQIVDDILSMTVARSLWKVIPEDNQEEYFSNLLGFCYHYCKPLFKGVFEIMLISESGKIFKQREPSQ